MIIWFLVGYMWLYVHRPFEVWTWLGAMRIELLFAIFLFAVWLGASEKRPMGNIYVVGLLGYVFAVFVATMFSPFTDIFSNGDLYDMLKYVFLVVLIMTSVKDEKDFRILVTGFIIAAFLFIAHSYREFYNGNAVLAAGAVRLVGVGVTFSEFNDYGTLLTVMLPLLFPLITLCKKKWHYLFIAGYFLLTLRSVMLTGSRGAFIMFCSLLILPVLFSKHRFKLLLFIIVLPIIAWAAMSEDMKNRYRTIWDPTISEQANANRQSRLIGFYDGMDNWANYPLSGVGPGCHGTARGQPQQAHNLPGQIAGETGTLGVVAFMFLLSCFFINHFSIWNNYKFLQEKNLGKEGLYCWRVSFAVMFAMLMVLLQGLSLHNAYRFPLIWFGAFQAVAAILMQEKVDAAIRGKLFPHPPELPVKKK